MLMEGTAQYWLETITTLVLVLGIILETIALGIIIEANWLLAHDYYEAIILLLSIMQYYTFSVDCSFVCEEGFVPSSDCAACEVDNICLADNPCDNGECMLVSSPNQYTCKLYWY